MDYRGLLWYIVDYRGFLNMHHHAIAWITRSAPQDSDDTWKVWRRYGAYSSLHRSCAILLLLWIAMDYRLSWNILEYRGLSWIIVDDNGSRTMVNYDGLWTIMGYRGLMGLIMGHGLPWTIVDYCGTVWIIMDYCGFLNMYHHGTAWIRRYAPQASHNT